MIFCSRFGWGYTRDFIVLANYSFSSAITKTGMSDNLLVAEVENNVNCCCCCCCWWSQVWFFADANCVAAKVKKDGTGLNVGKWDLETCKTLNPYVCKKPGSRLLFFIIYFFIVSGLLFVISVDGTKHPHLTTTPKPWPPQCGPYWVFEAVTGFCYRASEERLTWSDAQQVQKLKGYFRNKVGNVAFRPA